MWLVVKFSNLFAHMDAGAVFGIVSGFTGHRLRPHWPRRKFPGGSEAIRVPSFPSPCLFCHPTDWKNDLKV